MVNNRVEMAFQASECCDDTYDSDFRRTILLHAECIAKIKISRLSCCLDLVLWMLLLYLLLDDSPCNRQKLGQMWQVHAF